MAALETLAEADRRDGQGRRLWSADAMRAAEVAYRRWRKGRGPALTPDQVDAFRAFYRWRTARAHLEASR